MYWVLRALIILSPTTSSKSTFFQNFNVVSDSARRDISKEPIKS